MIKVILLFLILLTSCSFNDINTLPEETTLNEESEVFSEDDNSIIHTDDLNDEIENTPEVLVETESIYLDIKDNTCVLDNPETSTSDETSSLDDLESVSSESVEHVGDIEKNVDHYDSLLLIHENIPLDDIKNNNDFILYVMDTNLYLYNKVNSLEHTIISNPNFSVSGYGIVSANQRFILICLSVEEYNTFLLFDNELSEINYIFDDYNLLPQGFSDDTSEMIWYPFCTLYDWIDNESALFMFDIHRIVETDVETYTEHWKTDLYTYNIKTNQFTNITCANEYEYFGVESIDNENKVIDLTVFTGNSSNINNDDYKENYSISY